MNANEVTRGKETKLHSGPCAGQMVKLTGETMIGQKTGKLYVAACPISYPFKTVGKLTARYGKPQWIRAEILA